MVDDSMIKYFGERGDEERVCVFIEFLESDEEGSSRFVDLIIGKIRYDYVGDGYGVGVCCCFMFC